VSQFFGSRPLGPIAWSTVAGSAVTATAIAAMPNKWLGYLTGAVQRLRTEGTQAAAAAASCVRQAKANAQA
jgi:hypothetical protein